MLFEGSDRVLGTFAKDLSESAKKQLEDLGVEVRLNSFVTDIEPGQRKGRRRMDRLRCRPVGDRRCGSPSGKRSASRLDKAGRVFVEPDLSLPGYQEYFRYRRHGLAQAGERRAGSRRQPGGDADGNARRRRTFCWILKAQPRKNFTYVDKGTMATIGRSKAIADLRGWHFSGFIAWMMWLFLHVFS